MGYLKGFAKNRKAEKVKRDILLNLDKILTNLNKQHKGFEKVVLLLQKKYITDFIPTLFNSYLFFRISFIDIISNIKLIRIEENELNKSILTRTLAVQLCEFLQDFTSFTGKMMKAELEKLTDKNILIKDLYKLKEIYEVIYGISYKSLVDIRNNSGAHKDKNALVLSRKINEINHDAVQVQAFFCVILFMLIITFQNNVLYSIWDQYNKDPETMIPLKNPIKYCSIEEEFRIILSDVFRYLPNIGEIINKPSYKEIIETLFVIEIIKIYKFKN